MTDAPARFTITPPPEDEARAAYKQAHKRIEAWPELPERIENAAGENAAALVDLICWGEWLWLTDGRFRQPKADRDASARRIVKAARELAAALRETTWPGFAERGYHRGPDGGNRYLTDDLDDLATHAEAMQDQGPDFRDHYPPALSRTERRGFMLRHIKYAIRGHLGAGYIALAAEIATAVLDEQNPVTEDDIKKA